LVYYVFDLMMLYGENITDEPLSTGGNCFNDMF